MDVSLREDFNYCIFKNLYPQLQLLLYYSRICGEFNRFLSQHGQILYIFNNYLNIFGMFALFTIQYPSEIFQNRQNCPINSIDIIKKKWYD